MFILPPENHQKVSHVFVSDVSISNLQELSEELAKAVYAITVEQAIPQNYVIGKPKFKLAGLWGEELENALNKKTVKGELFVYVHHYTAIGYTAKNMPKKLAFAILAKTYADHLEKEASELNGTIDFCEMVQSFLSRLNCYYNHYSKYADDFSTEITKS